LKDIDLMVRLTKAVVRSTSLPVTVKTRLGWDEATINIEEVGNYGEVSVFSPAKEGLEKAVAWIKGITAMPEVGSVYEATVKGIKEFGAFVEFLPGKQGLLHISEISHKRLETMEGVL
jgi:polyribonucleotide nucleotidyltransferase